MDRSVVPISLAPFQFLLVFWIFLTSVHTNPNKQQKTVVSLSLWWNSKNRIRGCVWFFFLLRVTRTMGQQNLIYSFVARGTVILVEYTEFKGNFTAVAAQCLQKLPSSNNKFTYNCDGHTFNYLVENGFSESLLLDLYIWFSLSLKLALQ